MLRTNPNSPIRSGYAFEDLFVLKLCSLWLLAPNEYKEIRIQSIPDEVNSTKFYLDDVILVSADEKYHLFQIKHKQNPITDQWTFDSLLEKNGKKESLLKKWSDSYSLLPANKAKGSFHTNGYTNREISACLVDNKLNLDQINLHYPNTYKRVIEHFDNIDSAKLFLDNFSFHFAEPNLEELEKDIRNTFYKEIRVTTGGVNALLLMIINEGRKRYPRSFTIDSIRDLLEWYKPRVLNQNFEVPKDFELFSALQNDNIIDDLRNITGGVKVIIGKPGAGKSTYLSNLYKTLTEKLDVFSVRHHYHLNPKDNSYHERLDADRAIEGLKATFNAIPEEIIGHLKNQNNEHTPLKEFINVVAQYYHNQGKTFVLIVDGLDHVIRERKSESELSKFLEAVLYPQPGLWIILGTQEQVASHFPPLIFRCCPKNKWIEIKGLMKTSVSRIVNKNLTKNQLRNGELKKEFLRDIFNLTKGNPLHLRYVIKQLQLEDGYIDSYALKKLLPYKEDIADYYADLWKQLPSLSQTFALAISILDFKLKENEIFELGSYIIAENPTGVSDGFKNIQHLLKSDLSGISVFHNSFLVFIKNQEELAQQKNALYLQLRLWLQNSSNDRLKWGQLPIIEYYLGNHNPVLSLTKDWLIDSFIACRSAIQMINLLILASEAAFTKKDYEKVVELNTLASYFENRDTNLYRAFPKLWHIAFALNANTKIEYPDIEILDHYQIKDYLISLGEKGIITTVPEEAYYRFNELLSSNKSDASDIIVSWISILSHFSNVIPQKRVVNFIKQFRGNNASGRYFAKYVSLLLELGKEKELKELLKIALSDDEKEEIVIQIIQFDLAHNTDLRKKLGVLKSLNINASIINIYHLLKSKKKLILSPLPNTSDFQFKLDHFSSQTGQVYNFYERNLLNGINWCLIDKEKEIISWTEQMPGTWPIKLMKGLFEVGSLLAKSIQLKIKFEYKQVLSVFDKLELITFHEHSDIFELRRYVVPEILKSILKIGGYINISNSIDEKYSIEDLHALQQCKWFYSNTLVEHLNTFKNTPVSKSNIPYLIKSLWSDRINKIEPFNEKADFLADLALLALDNNHLSIANDLLKQGTDYILAYGNHKDYKLHNILSGIEICAKTGSTKVSHFIDEVTPYVYHIKDLTDGDETGSLINKLATLYGQHEIQMLYKLLHSTFEEQDWYDTDSFFGDVVSTLNLSETVDASIAGTAVDREGYNTLCFMAKSDKNAKKILQSIQSDFGKIDYSDDRHSAQTSSYKHKSKKINFNVSPSKLWEYLNSIKSEHFYRKSYQQRQYLLQWLTFQLNNKKYPEQEIFTSIKQYIDNTGFEDLGEDILLLFYPLARKYNRDFAFECLIWAHANGYIWGPDWSKRLPESRKLWSVVIEDYPRRIDEYFARSIYNTGKHYDEGGTYFIPIPKSLQFFIDIDRKDIAESLLEASIKSLKKLFPINLPTPKFLLIQKQFDKFDVLLLRLKWINSTVRERAASAISELLINDSTGSLYKRVVAWLYEQKLNSFQVYGLIVLLKSLEKPTSNCFQHINVYELTDAVDVTLTPHYLLVCEICSKLKIDPPDLLKISSVDADAAIAHDIENFKKSLGYFIPYYPYFSLCEAIDKNTNTKPFNIWCNLYEDKAKELFVSTRDHSSYCNGKNDFMNCRASIQSEMLKSTFVDLIEYLFSKGVLSYQELLSLSVKILPIDLSIWKIKLSTMPKWWAKIDFNNGQTEKEIVERIERFLKEIVNEENDWQLFHLSGLVLPESDFYSSKGYVRIKMLPFAYDTQGTNFPDAKAIYKTINNFGTYSPVYIRPYSLMNNEVVAISDSDIPAKNKDLLISPLLLPLDPTTNNSWQYYRWSNDFTLLSPEIDGVRLQLNNGKMQYIDRHSKHIVCKVNDFLFGLRDRMQYRTPIPHGRFSLMEKNFLSAFLLKKKVRIAYVYRISCDFRESTYSEESKRTEFYGLINFIP